MLITDSLIYTLILKKGKKKTIINRPYIYDTSTVVVIDSKDTS